MRAKQEYAASGQRLARLGGTLTSEPAWNMLLDLFVSGAQKRILSVSALTIGSRAAPATALRYLKLLVEADLVERQFDELDGRRVHVQLTSAGWRTVAGLLTSTSTVEATERDKASIPCQLEAIPAEDK